MAARRRVISATKQLREAKMNASRIGWIKG
jgi:hypothetical protein